ncbi:MAG TPA: gliding motility-associated C-terminal domain-containing protein [Saprospiraceae bacterium]|nr:gliding motility-associated C-terminal domain-containing protein [Saprospiraceae bacterium]
MKHQLIKRKFKQVLKWICFLFIFFQFQINVYSQPSCCCGSPRVLDFPGFDFEFPPDPPPGWFIWYPVGSLMGPWLITTGYVDHVDKAHYFNTASGNPNGATNFVDLYGTIPTTGSYPGAMQYTLTGLTPSYLYTLEFYYAKFDVPGDFRANIKVAKGNWLDVKLTATNPGNVIWLKASYKFVAQAVSADLEFIDISPSYGVGVLIDDITIYECPNDIEKPNLQDPPEDVQVECDAQIPPVPKLIATDDCDANPIISYKESKTVLDVCKKKILREWTVKDACGNSSKYQQVIDVFDENPPDFSNLPFDLSVNCDADIQKEFNAWIKSHGNAVATDACGAVSWRTIYDHVPKSICDSVLVDFIATDICGNERVESAYFIVKDLAGFHFNVKPQDKIINSGAAVRDSLRDWLTNFAYSSAKSNCDTVIFSTNFNGDSSKNPLILQFYIKDRCGNIDSATATFGFRSSSSVTCCCGTPNELFYSNLDFEAPPTAPPGGWIDYSAGDNYAGWSITSGSISIHDPAHLNLGDGNPNGSTQHMDLHGFNQGSASYTLTGLTAGNEYTINFWYAIHSFGSNVSARLTVNGGSLLNTSWSATNSGNVVWLEKSVRFIADGPVATMEFTGTGASPCCGMLIDDIRIFECVLDKEKPEVTNPPDDLEFECDMDVTKAPVLTITDNCDLNPKQVFKEVKEVLDACTKKITRTWEITDACGNTATEDQLIFIIDKTDPQFTKDPENKWVSCDKDLLKEFNDWLQAKGNAKATDLCGVVNWRTSYDHSPFKSCDSILGEFIAADPCGHEVTKFAWFVVQDTSAPKFLIPSQNINLVCVPGIKDSLRNWLLNFGYSSNAADCDTIIKSNNFDGDSTKNPIVVTFYAKDRCGNVDSSTARFTYRSGTDTIRITQFSCTFPGNSLDTMIFSSGGCDSVVISERIRRSADSTYITANSCDPKIKAFDTLRLNNQFGCDSFIFTHILIHPVDTSRQKIYDCSFTSMSVDTAVFIGQFCDSIVLTEKIPLRKDSIFIQQSSCDSLAAGVKVFNLINANGCDSVVSINTTFSGVIIQLITKNECGLAKNYIDTLIFSTSSCDSLVITNHIGLKIDTSNIQRSSCDLTQAGIDTLIYQTATCDSIVIVNTLFIPADTTYVQQTSCDINQVGISSKLYNTSTCDSLVIINTQFIPSDTTRINLTTCDISQVGIDSIFFTTSTCDSLVITTTSFKSSDTSRINQTTCLPASAGLDTVLLQKSNGCDSLVITNTLLVPLRLQFKLDSITCHDKADAKISILNEQDFNKPYTVYLNQSNVGQQNQLTNLGPGIYKVYIKDRLGCITDSIEIDLQNPEAFITELGSEQLVTKGSQVQLQLQTNHTWQHIQWNPSGVIGCMDCNPVNFKVDQDTWIYSLAIDERNCESLDSVLIRVREERKVFVPNSFSPNGDNINDYFYVQGDDQAVVEIMQIFDRWGNQVFEIKNVAVNDPLKGWNGKTGERYLNPGVYVYYIEIQTNLLEKQRIWGDISLIR